MESDSSKEYNSISQLFKDVPVRPPSLSLLARGILSVWPVNVNHRPRFPAEAVSH